MQTIPPVRRVILVVLDGLRPDSVDAFDLHRLRSYAARGAFTPCATTVSPSVTAAAMASLLTGVPPLHHGLMSDRFHIPKPRAALTPLPALLGASGLPVYTFVRELPLLFRPLARACATKLGVRSPTFSGGTAREILAAARRTLCERRDGLILLHWPDADMAGHEHGWMSSDYGAACRALDDALGTLVREECILEDPDTLLVVLADHGGGGLVANDHEGDHEDNLTIPVLFLGGGVSAMTLEERVSILDVAPTVAWALGVQPPASWPGRALQIIAPRVRVA
jgi:predicted AlkP superfamily pyrophosphatase or phosphodiesterase